MIRGFRRGLILAIAEGMIHQLSLTLLVGAAAQEQLVADLQNFLARVARGLVRLGSGNETLIITILILLLIMYLYLRKA